MIGNSLGALQFREKTHLRPEQSQAGFQAFEAICHDNRALRSHSEFLAQQLWRQGQAYQQLAVHCNEAQKEHMTSNTKLTKLRADLDVARRRLETERQRHTVTQDAHRYEARRRESVDKSLATACNKIQSLELIATKMGLIKSEDIEAIFNENVEVATILDKDWMTAHGLTNAEREFRSSAFTIECYRQLVGNLKERHEYMVEYMNEKDTELQQMREEAHAARGRTAMLMRRKP